MIPGEHFKNTRIFLRCLPGMQKRTPVTERGLMGDVIFVFVYDLSHH